MGSNEINHTGTIIKIDDRKVEVMILAQSACSACHSKSLCSLSEMKEKVIQVTVSKEDFEPGELVNVIMSASLGILAVFYAYLFPLIILIGTLVGLTLAGVSELMIGLTIVVLLIAYFFILYSFRNRLAKKFSFKIEKI